MSTASPLKPIPDFLRIDPEEASREIETALRQQVLQQLHRRGAVVGLSGGVDSSVVAALCARALGKDRVLGVLMPERVTSDDSSRLAHALADRLGIQTVLEDIAPALDALGCYRRQEEAIRTAFPDYRAGWRCKLSLPAADDDRLAVYQLTVESPAGERRTARLSPSAYLQLVAATNFKQRVRKSVEYYHADRLGWAVAGTPNRLEYDQGFFVKQGDGDADIKPIAHLYKTQVHALAESLGVPEEICLRPSTTETFSLPQTQEEFFFTLPLRAMDLCLYGYENSLALEDVASAAGITPVQVERTYRNIERRRRTTRYLREPALFVREPRPARVEP